MILKIPWSGSKFWRKQLKRTIYSQTPLFPMERITNQRVSMVYNGMVVNVSMPRRIWSRQALNLTS